jgi:hypothetical protein
MKTKLNIKALSSFQINDKTMDVVESANNKG